MHYLTRHLVALRDLPIGDRLVANGEAFYATATDADHMIFRKQAVEAPGAVQATRAAALPLPATTATAAATASADNHDEPAGHAPVGDPTATEASGEAEVTAETPASRRRGRPTNAEKLARQTVDAGADSPAAGQP